MTIYRLLLQMAGLYTGDVVTLIDATQKRAALTVLLRAVVAETKYATDNFVAPLVSDYLRSNPDQPRTPPNTQWKALNDGDSRQAVLELRQRLSEFDKLYLLSTLWRLARADQMESFYEALYIRTAYHLLGARHETYLEAKRLFR